MSTRVLEDNLTVLELESRTPPVRVPVGFRRMIMTSRLAGSAVLASKPAGSRSVRAVVLGLVLIAHSLPAQQAGVPALPAWMTGCWRQVQAGVIIDEVWLTPAGGALIGVSRSVEADSLRSHETMIVRAGANGLVFEAAPSGQPAAVFLASMVTDTSVAFENLTHDFPQVIRYAKRGGDSLLAMISGTVRDRQRTINYAYGRVSCPGD